ncbi:MAG: hypothetical protein WAU67_22525, partial [Terracidiphilus sp.]
LYALVLAVAISLPAFLWISHVSPHWFSEMMANVQASRGRGGLNDPGPSSAGGRGIQMITDLQAVFSLVRDNPGFYNLASYIVCAPLLLLWAIGAIRARVLQAGAGGAAWFSIAAITALTMLPIYHRQYDAKLILLVVPAFCILLAEGGRKRKLAIWITAIAFVLNGDFTWLILIHFITKIPNTNLAQFLLVAPVPLSLLAMGGFYLWAGMRGGKEPTRESVATTS